MKLYVKDNNGSYVPATIDETLEAAKSAANVRFRRGSLIQSPGTSKDFLHAQLAGEASEVFAVLFLDNRHRIIRYRPMFFGTIDGANVYVREVVKAALEDNSAAVILAHNHPSGDSTPSPSDQRITQRLKDALALIDVRVLDHIVVGADTYSFAEHGLL